MEARDRWPVQTARSAPRPGTAEPSPQAGLPIDPQRYGRYQGRKSRRVEQLLLVFPDGSLTVRQKLADSAARLDDFVGGNPAG